ALLQKAAPLVERTLGDRRRDALSEFRGIYVRFAHPSPDHCVPPQRMIDEVRQSCELADVRPVGGRNPTEDQAPVVRRAVEPGETLDVLEIAAVPRQA